MPSASPAPAPDPLDKTRIYAEHPEIEGTAVFMRSALPYHEGYVEVGIVPGQEDLAADLAAESSPRASGATTGSGSKAASNPSTSKE